MKKESNQKSIDRSAMESELESALARIKALTDLKEDDDDLIKKSEYGLFDKFNIKKDYRERKLLQIASGKNAMVATAWALFGSAPITSIIGKANKNKATEEEKEAAKAELIEKHGYKRRKKKDEKDPKGSKKEDDKQSDSSGGLDEIRKSLDSLKALVASVAAETKNNTQSINKVLMLMVALATQKSSATPSSPEFSQTDFKPQTVVSDDKEYLYYPDAPEGRKFYEKSKTGSAGKIAPKEVQKKLKPQISRLGSDKEEATKEIIKNIFENSQVSPDIINNILQTVNKNPVEKLQSFISNETNNVDNISSTVQQLIASSPMQTTGVAAIEADEMQKILSDALKEALERVLKENPDLLSAENPNGKGILSNIVDIASNIPKIFTRGGASKSGGKGLGKILSKSLTKKIPGLAVLAGLMFAAPKAMGGDFTGAAMEVGSGLLGSLPGLGTIASLGLDAILADRDAKSMVDQVELDSKLQPFFGPRPTGQAIDVLREKLIPKETVTIDSASITPQSSANLAPQVNEIGKQIIQSNRETESMVRLEPRNLLPVQTEVPRTPRIINNNTIISSTPDSISTTNNDNTFNRLTAQMAEHPATYSNFYVG